MSGGSPGAPGWYVHDQLAGLWSARPEPFMSIARTSNLWLPGARFEYCIGYSQSSQARSSFVSRRHSKTSSVMGETSSRPL